MDTRLRRQNQAKPAFCGCFERHALVSRLIAEEGLGRNPASVGMLIGSLIGGALRYCQNSEKKSKDRKEKAAFVAELTFSILTVFYPASGPGGLVARKLAERLFDSESYQDEARYMQALFHLSVRDGDFGFSPVERLEIIDSMNLALTANGIPV